MNDSWHYTCEGTEQGPAPRAELRRLAAQGLLRPTDLLWQEGMVSWVRASTLSGLLEDQPPPMDPLPLRASDAEGGGAGVSGGNDVPEIRLDRRSPRSSRPSSASSGKRKPRQNMTAGAKVMLGLGGLVAVAGVVVGLTILFVNLSRDNTPPRPPIKGGPPPVAMKKARPKFAGGALVSSYQVQLNDNQQDARFFDLVGGGTYEIRVDSEHDSDVDLFVIDLDNNQIAFDDQPDADCLVNFVAPHTGRFRVEVDNLGPGNNRCTVTIRRLDGPAGQQPQGKINNPAFPPGGMAPVGPQPKPQALTPTREGTRVQDRLHGQDASDHARAGHFCKVFEAPLRANRTYVIDMVSMDFDSYLRLENAAGVQVAFDDDGGGNLNARIMFRPDQDGTFRIFATTFGPGAIGAFNLIVREE